MQRARRIHGKKYMWDGVVYKEMTTAVEALNGYRERGFDAQLVEEENGIYVFTRRPVEATQAEGGS